MKELKSIEERQKIINKLKKELIAHGKKTIKISKYYIKHPVKSNDCEWKRTIKLIGSVMIARSIIIKIRMIQAQPLPKFENSEMEKIKRN